MSSGEKKKFTPVKPAQSSNPRVGTPSSQAKKQVLKALNDQLKIRAQRLESRKKTSPQTTPEKPDNDAPSASREPTPSRIPVKTPNRKPEHVVQSESESVLALRQSVVSRKYGGLWLDRTFGSRVRPREARDHWERSLLRRVFREWRERWWQDKVEWRLDIRAQCHDKYRHYRRVWNAWKQFVIISRIKRAKRQLAESHYETCLASQALSAWRQYIDSRHHKHRQDRRAAEFADNNLLQLCWSTWREQQRLLVVDDQLEEVARQFWATQTITKAWLCWRRHLVEVAVQKEKEALAEEHHQTVVLAGVLRAWRLYADRRRHKAGIKANVDRFYHGKLVRRAFTTWSHRRLTLSLIRHREEDISQSAARFQTRRVFQHWKHYIDLKREKFAKEVLADEHYRETLLSLGLRGLRAAVTRTNIQLCRKQLADQCRANTLVSDSWRLWVSRCDQNEEIRTIPQRRVATNHYNRLLMKKAVGLWQMYVQWRRRRQGDYIRADAYHTMRTLPRYLSALHEHARLAKRKRRLHRKAEDFYRENTEAKYFYTWHHELELTRHRRTMMRVAILHHEDTTIASAFLQWKLSAQVAMATRNDETMATRHHLVGICERAFDAWRRFVAREKDKRQNKRLAVQCYQGNKVEKAWLLWKQRYESVETEQRHLDASVCHHGNRLLRVAMAAWREHHAQWKRVEAEVERRVQERHTQIKRQMFLEWRENAGESRTERFLCTEADTHYNITLARKVLVAWQGEAADLAEKHQTQNRQITEARRQLDASLLKSFFRRWSSRRDEALLSRLKFYQAAIHHGQRVKHRCLTAWRQYVQQRRRKTLLHHQATWYNKTRLLVEAFVTWRAWHAEKRQENEQTGVALWHWSLVLQAKVFSAWFGYSRERCRKKQRWARAMASRQMALQTDAVRQWLATAAQLQAMREKWMANREAQSVYSAHHIIRRCADHWRQWARRRREGRGETANHAHFRPGPACPKPGSAYCKSDSAYLKSDFAQPKPFLERRLATLPPRDLISSDINPRLPKPDLNVRTAPSLAEPWANQRVAYKPGQSRSPVVVAPRPKPRLPDFLVESVEASLMKRKEEKILGRKEIPCFRMDEADIGHPRSSKFQPIPGAVPNPPRQQQPIRRAVREPDPHPRSLLAAGEPSRTVIDPVIPVRLLTPSEFEPIGDGVRNTEPFRTKDHESKVTNQIQVSPSKHLMLNGQKHVLSPSRGVRKEKLTLMTPDMFLTAANQSPGKSRSRDVSANQSPVKFCHPSGSANASPMKIQSASSSANRTPVKSHVLSDLTNQQAFDHVPATLVDDVMDESDASLPMFLEDTP